MDDTVDAEPQNPSESPVDRSATPGSTISRRDLFRLTLAGGSGLAVGGLLDMPPMRAATQDVKLSDVSQFTTSYNFCSCGCGMIAVVRGGKLLTGLRIDHCESCRGYLKTYDGQGNETLWLADWSSLHLDLIAHDRD